jgi:hypothetical protein
MKPMEKMCDNCPFGHTEEQEHMRKSLQRGRFNEICQSVFQGYVFACHKTTTHDDDDGEWVPTERDRECAGAILFREAAIANREEAERRARKVPKS